MRVLFYLLDGETNASSRHRALQYFPLLRQHGFEPFASRPVPEAMYQAWMEGDRPSAPRRAAFYSSFLLSRLIHVLRGGRFDVVVIQRDLFPFGPPVLERLLARINSRLVYDTDDATYVRPAFTPGTPFQKLRRFGKVAQVVSAARWVSVATEPIAAWARRFNPSVSVVPMAVDLDEYDRARRPARSADRVILGWAGTAGGLRYLHALGPVLREVAEKHAVEVRVISGGYRHAHLPGVPLVAQPWQPRSALDDLAGFDVGLVPLDDSPFEQAKFPFKLLQFMALGIPAVSARVGVATSVLRDGENGLLVRSAQEWQVALERLIVDVQLRGRLGRAGRETVAERYTVARIGPLLLDGLSRVAAGAP